MLLILKAADGEFGLMLEPLVGRATHVKGRMLPQPAFQ
jgi:hypothetical protein